MDELKVGLIGAGKMGLLHAGIFNSLEGCRISAIAEKDRFVTSILSKYLPGVNIYRDYEAMIEKEDLDIIAITTPVYLHKMMIEKAIDHYLNIFVEKPLALNGKECRSILAKNCRAKTEVGYPRRFMDTYNLAKNIIDASTLGDANYCQSQLFVGQIFKQGRGWLYDPAKSGGGVLMDLGSHVVDLLHHLFGEVSSVHGMGGSVFNQNVEDYISVNLKFKNRLFGSSQISWSVRNYRLPELKINIHMDEGVIIATEKYIEIWSEVEDDLLKKGWNIFYKQDLIKDVPINIGGPEYTLEDLHLVTCIREDRETSCNFQEAAKANFVIDAIYSSIMNDQVEKVNYGG